MALEFIPISSLFEKVGESYRWYETSQIFFFPHKEKAVSGKLKLFKVNYLFLHKLRIFYQE